MKISGTFGEVLTYGKNTARKHALKWKAPILAGVTATALLLAAEIIRGPSYTVQAVLVPRGGLATSTLGNIATQFGLSLPNQDALNSPSFFADLSVTDEVLRRIAIAPIGARGDNAPTPIGSIADYWGIRENTPEARSELAARRLRSELSVMVNSKSQMIYLAFACDDPKVAYGVVRNAAIVLDSVTNLVRRSLSSADAEFASEGTKEFGDSLRIAEERLAQYMVRNRAYRDSPDLSAEVERLQRAVRLAEQVYVGVLQSKYQATLETSRSTPLLSVIMPSRPPEIADPRHVALKAILAFLIGAGAYLWAMERHLLLGMWRNDS